jgi:hypothetical protein
MTPADAPAKADGTLRRVSDQTWEGTLHGRRVIVSSASGWHFAVISPQGHTEVCPRVGSLAEGARRVPVSPGPESRFRRSDGRMRRGEEGHHVIAAAGPICLGEPEQVLGLAFDRVATL